MMSMESKQIQNLENKINQLSAELGILKQTINKGRFSNLFVYDTPVKFRFGIDIGNTNISTGTNPGSSFGIAGDKISFLGATPISKQNTINKPSGGATTDSQARTAINSLIDLIKNYGLSS